MSMLHLELTPEQREIVLAPVGNPRTTFLTGPAGCGKSTTGVRRLLYLLEVGVRPDSILVWVPQRSLGLPYLQALRDAQVPAGPQVDVLSLDGLARRTLDLFWPLVAAPAGFSPSREPRFLTLETAQYYLDQVLQPFIEGGRFGDVVITRNRLLSQIIDNLNKAALVGFPYTEIATRLTNAWSGHSSRERVYEAVQEAARAFRDYCLQHNLLDFSLQLETFARHVWPHPQCRAYLLQRYRHLIAENVEEDVPIAHDLLRDWIGRMASVLLICDQGGGFRTYLGADPVGAQELADLCERRVLMEQSFVSLPAVQALESRLAQQVQTHGAQRPSPLSRDQVDAALEVFQEYYHTELLRRVVDEVLFLIKRQGVTPAEIAIVAPFVDDALRFALVTDLERQGIPVRTHRPSRALREEPAVRCLLTLARLSHPHWEMAPHRDDVAHALAQAIDGLDWVRARYLADLVYRRKEHRPHLSSFMRLRPEVQERITFSLGRLYDDLLHWIEAYTSGAPVLLDVFLGRLCQDLLLRPGYGFHDNWDAATAAANLIESVSKFRQVLDVDAVDEVGKCYLTMVDRGVVAAQYLHGWKQADEAAVFVGPAYTFLSENRLVSYQFWLQANSLAWGRRLYQPLTHPFVLTRYWPSERRWTEEDEVLAGQVMLQRVLLGLLRRCRVKVYLGMSELNARGYEERGPLLEWIQRVLRQVREMESGHV